MNRYSKFILLCAVLGLLTGCASNSGRGSRLMPWNWFAPDHVQLVTDKEVELDEAERDAVKSAQRENAKTIEALNTAPSADRSVKVAKRTAGNAQAILDKAIGGISPDELFELRQTVAGLISENADIRADSEIRQVKDEVTISKQGQQIDSINNELATAIGKLKKSDRKYQAQAESNRKLKFWIITAIGVWIGLQILSGISKFYPGLAPLARTAGFVSAPVLQSANNKLHAGVGEAIASAQKVSAVLADQMRSFLDKPLDDDNKAAIRATVQKLT